MVGWWHLQASSVWTPQLLVTVSLGSNQGSCNFRQTNEVNVTANMKARDGKQFNWRSIKMAFFLHNCNALWVSNEIVLTNWIALLYKGKWRPKQMNLSATLFYSWFAEITGSSRLMEFTMNTRIDLIFYKSGINVRSKSLFCYTDSIKAKKEQ